jgi:hypothetical protein
MLVIFQNVQVPHPHFQFFPVSESIISSRPYSRDRERERERERKRKRDAS